MPEIFGKSPRYRRRSVESSRHPAFRAGQYAGTAPRIWLDVGTREGPRIVDDVEMLRDALMQKRLRLGENLHYQRVEGAEHNEAAWAQRVGPFLEFLFPAG